MDALNALANLIIGFYRTKKAQDWCKLIFQMAFSSLTSFLYTTGSMLVTLVIASISGASVVISGTPVHVPLTCVWPISIGSGLVSSAIRLTYFWRTSPLTKGMTAVLPAEEAGDELNSNQQVITKPKD